MLCAVALALFCIQSALSASLHEVLPLTSRSVVANISQRRQIRTSSQQTSTVFNGEASTERTSVPNVHKSPILYKANYGDERTHKSNMSGLIVNGEEKSFLFPALMPEDVRYAKTRCGVDYPEAILNWTLQDFSNRAEARQTYCYVKCFLRRLGLIQLDTLGWDLTRLGGIFSNLGGDKMFESKCFDMLHEAKAMSGNCEPHYKVWMKLFRDCRMGFKYLFYYDVRPLELPFVKPLPPSREMGVEPAKFCADLFPQAINDTQIQFYTLCTYLQFHYFDGYGRLDESEILRSFKYSGHLTAITESRVKACVHLANGFFKRAQSGIEMANRLNTCMTKHLPEVFFTVLQHWNQIMREY